MSRDSELDERILSMQFDNDDFERNANESISTLDKLKRALKFGKETDEIEDVEESFDGMGNAIQLVGQKFSALEIAGITALQNIVNKGVNKLEAAIKGVSIDQVSAGWDKYGEKTSAVQAIMSSTGLSIDEVTEQLDKLNWFTDETSYNFVDMVDNISKFTSHGVELDKAVTAMQGIALEAALAGRGTNEASRAMYNFAQALGSGKVKLLDWRSIQNANLDTMEFKQVLVDTAVEMGTLTKQGDKYYLNVNDEISDATESVVKSTKKILNVTKNAYVEQQQYAKSAAKQINTSNEVSLTNFEETLSEDWFTSDVLLEALTKYGSTANEIFEYVQENGGTASEALEKMGLDTEELGYRAFVAGQQAKTLEEALNSVKDATSTGWMNTFELLFGNYEEAKIIWTDLANTLYDVFAGPINDLNEVLSEWKAAGFQNIFIRTFRKGYAVLAKIGETVKKAWTNVFPEITAERIGYATTRIYKFVKSLILSEKRSAQLQRIFSAIFRVVKHISIATTTLGKAAITIVKPIVTWLFEGLSRLAGWINAITLLAEKTGLLDAVMGKIRRGAEKISEVLSELFGGHIIKDVRELSSSKLLDKIGQKFKMIADRMNGESDSGSILSDILSSLLKIFQKVGQIGIKSFQLVQTIFTKIVTKVLELMGYDVTDKTDLLSTSLEALSGLLDWILDILTKLNEKIEAFGIKEEGAEESSSLLSRTLGKVKEKFDSFLENHPRIVSFGESVVNAFDNIKTHVGDALDFIIEKIKLLKLGDILRIVGTLIGYLAVKNITAPLAGFGELLSGIAAKVRASGILDVAKTIKTVALSILMLTASLFVLAMLNTEDIARGLGGIFALLIMLVAAFGVISKIVKSMNRTESSGGDKKKGFLGKIGDIIGGLFGGVEIDSTWATLLGIAGAILMLTAAVTTLAKLDIEKLWSSMLAIFVLIVGLILVFDSISSNNSFEDISTFGPALFMLGLAKVIKSLADSIKELSALNCKDTLAAAASILIAMIGIVSLFAFGKFESATKKVGKAVVLIATAIGIMASSIETLTHLVESSGAINVLIAAGIIAGFMLAFTAMLWLLAKATEKANAGKISAVGASIALMGLSMLLVAHAVKPLAEYSWEEILPGAIALAVLMAEMAIIAGILGKPELKVLAGAGAMVLMAGAMLILAGALFVMSKIPADRLIPVAVTLGILAVVMGVIAGVLGYIGPFVLIGALAMVVLAIALIGLVGSLYLLVGALELFAALDMDKITANLTQALTTMAAMALVLTLLSPLMLIAGGVMLVFGLGCVALGGGLLLLSKGITAFIEMISLVGVTTSSIFQKIGEVGKTVIGTIGKVIGGIFGAIKSVVGTVFDIVSGIFGWIFKGSGDFFDGMFSFFNSVGEKAAEIVGGIVDKIKSGAGKVVGAIKGLFGKGEEAVEEEPVPTPAPTTGGTGAKFVSKPRNTSKKDNPFLNNGKYDVNYLKEQLKNGSLNGLSDEELQYYLEDLNKEQQNEVIDITKAYARQLAEPVIMRAEEKKRQIEAQESAGEEQGTAMGEGFLGGLGDKVNSIKDTMFSDGGILGIFGGATAGQEFKSTGEEQGGIFGTGFLDGITSAFQNAGTDNSMLGNLSSLFGSAGEDITGGLETSLGGIFNMDGLVGDIGNVAGTETIFHEFGTLTVEGVNNEGEFIASSDYAVDEIISQMTKEFRLG